MSGWSPEELRRAALESLGDHADPRARDALQHGDLVVDAGVSSWEGSAGRVEAHRVTLSLDAERLGRVRASHATVDALHAALARAVAGRPGQTLGGLQLRWSRGIVRATSRGYRDGPPPGQGTLAQALVAYLEGAGHADLASIVDGCDLVEGPAVRLRLDARRKAQLDAHLHAVPTLSEALRDLLARPATSVIVES